MSFIIMLSGFTSFNGTNDEIPYIEGSTVFLITTCLIILVLLIIVAWIYWLFHPLYELKSSGKSNENLELWI